MITVLNQGAATELRCDRCDNIWATRFHAPSQQALTQSILIAFAKLRGCVIQSDKNGGPDLCSGCVQELKGNTT